MKLGERVWSELVLVKGEEVASCVVFRCLWSGVTVDTVTGSPAVVAEGVWSIPLTELAGCSREGVVVVMGTPHLGVG